MASYSAASRELVLKLVYYGPGLGGKTTTLKALHAAVRPEHRGRMISLATPVDRTLYFDFLPVRLPSVGDLQIRLQLFTVPGQVYFNATRKLVLTGADGVMFVADSQGARLDANTEALDNLRDNLKELGRSLEETPVVLAYNKRDLDDVLPVTELDRALNPHGFPSMATSASKGLGVFESLDSMVRVALDDLVRRRVLPAGVIVPSDGTVGQRLLSVQGVEKATQVEPATIVTGSSPTSMPTVIPPRPATPSFGIERETGGIELALASAVSSVESRDSGPRTGRRAASLAPLFDTDEHEAVRTIEDAIDEGLHARALLLLEALLVRVLDRTLRVLGRQEGAHEAAAWALGLQPERYARVRAVAQKARRGGGASRREVLEAYVLASSAQIALDAIAVK